MDEKQLQEILMELRFTAGLSEGDQRKLAAIARLKTFQTGETLFTEGT